MHAFCNRQAGTIVLLILAALSHAALPHAACHTVRGIIMRGETHTGVDAVPQRGLGFGGWVNDSTAFQDARNEFTDLRPNAFPGRSLCEQAKPPRLTFS